MKSADLFITPDYYYAWANSEIYFTGILYNYEELREELCANDAVSSIDNPAALILHIIQCTKRNKAIGVKKALLETVENLYGDYSIVLVTNEIEEKVYCMNRGSELIIGLEYNNIIVSDKVTQVLSRTNRTIKLSFNMSAEIFEDGTCLFTDSMGQRLNTEYLDIYHREAITPENQIINIINSELTGDLTGFFSSKDRVGEPINWS